MTTAAVGEFQTLLAATIALFGVAATLWCNARAARSQSERHRRQEAASLRTALRCEAELIGIAMTNQAEDLGKPVDPKWESELLPSRRLDDVYRALIPQIGKLSAAEVACILKLHGQYGMYLDKLALLSTNESDSPYLRIRPQYRAEVSVICLQVSAAAKEAVSALSKANY